MRLKQPDLMVAAAIGLLSAASAVADDHPRAKPADPGVVSDDDLSLVVGTRFVKTRGATGSPPALFREARVPLAAFNDTDRCIDEKALETAREYFTSLGRTLGKAGVYYILPEDQTKQIAEACQATRRDKPQAWVEGETAVVAFGKVLPTIEAPALAKDIE